MSDSRSKVLGEMALKLAFEEFGHWTQRFLQPGSDPERLLVDKQQQLGTILIDGLGRLKGSGLKILQNLALDEDLLPEPMLRQVEAAFGSVPPLSAPVVRKVVLQQLGKAPEEIFSHFEPEAFAAASLGQVHRARLNDGTAVVVKIQYPNVAKNLNAELSVVRRVAKAATNPLIRMTITEACDQLQREVDYKIELSNTDYFRSYWNDRGVRIPRTFAQYSSSMILVQEEISGKTFLQARNEGQVVSPKIYHQSIRFFFESMRHLQAVHADPHPANYMIDSNGQLAVIDFGLVKSSLNPQDIELMELLLSQSHKRHSIINLYRNMGADIDSNDQAESTFYNEVVAPFYFELQNILHQDSFDFSSHRARITYLRKSILSQCSRPELKHFSTQYTLVHKAMQSLFLMLAKMKACCSTRI